MILDNHILIWWFQNVACLIIAYLEWKQLKLNCLHNFYFKLRISECVGTCFFLMGILILVTISNIVFDYIFILLCPCGSYLISKRGPIILNNFRSNKQLMAHDFIILILILILQNRLTQNSIIIAHINGIS